jgi:hypothetical protein
METKLSDSTLYLEWCEDDEAEGENMTMFCLSVVPGVVIEHSKLAAKFASWDSSILDLFLLLIDLLLLHVPRISPLTPPSDT